MKTEDLEEGKTYVMLEDEIGNVTGKKYIKKGEKVKFLHVFGDIEHNVVVENCFKELFTINENKLGELPITVTTDKYEQHRQLCEKIHSTYVAKNKDYGDSFTRTRKEAKYPELVIVTRLSDKFYRLKTLLEGAEQQVKDESINDTLLDLANYCLMEIIERQNGKEENI